MNFRLLVAASVAMVAAVVLSGCTAVTNESGLDRGSAISVAAEQPLSSTNDLTSFGNTTANTTVAYLTNDWFNYYDDTPKLVKNESFGSYELVSEDPLTVKYEIADGVTWSDGTPVEAADLLLDWVANSRARDTPDFDPAALTDPGTNEFTKDLPSDVVYFDSGAQPDSGLGLVRETPTIGDNGRSVTMVYSAPFVDWELALPRAVPAHVVGKNALGLADAEAAKAAVRKAIQEDDRAALSKISSFWNSGFNFDSLPDDPGLYVGTGPYSISSMDSGASVTLTANPDYRGQHRPSIEEITIKVFSDPVGAVQALTDGDVDLISPPATESLAAELEELTDTTVLTGGGNTYEHLDLQVDQSRSGVFTDPRVREAFLKMVPRQQIVDELLAPISGSSASVRDSFVFMPGTTGYRDSVTSNGSADYGTVDRKGAQALLGEAGVVDPQVCILYEANNPRRVREFALIQSSAATAGFTVTDCGETDWASLLGTPNAYDAALFAWQSPTLAASNAAWAFGTDGDNNFTFLSNPGIDSALRELPGEFDQGRRSDLLHQVDALLWDDFTGVPLFQHPTVAAFDDRFTGISESPMPTSVYWNFWEWTTEKR